MEEMFPICLLAELLQLCKWLWTFYAYLKSGFTPSNFKNIPEVFQDFLGPRKRFPKLWGGGTHVCLNVKTNSALLLFLNLG